MRKPGAALPASWAAYSSGREVGSQKRLGWFGLAEWGQGREVWMGVKAERAAVWEGAKEVKTAVRVGVGEDWGTKDETRTISRVGEAVGDSCGGC